MSKLGLDAIRLYNSSVHSTLIIIIIIVTIVTSTSHILSPTY